MFKPSLLLLAVMLIHPVMVFGSSFLEINHLTLPDSKTKNGNRTVFLRQQAISLKVGETTLTPSSNTMRVNVALHDLVLSIGRIDIHGRKVVRCYNTRIHIAPRHILPLHASLGIRVLGGEIAVGDLRTSFEIPPKVFQAVGPAYCKGSIFAGLVKKIVAKAMADSREEVEQRIEEGIRAILPEASENYLRAFSAIR